MQRNFPFRFMKQSAAAAMLVLLFAFFSSPTFVMAQKDRKLAFLIGIGNYPAAGGWQQISAPNDLVVMREVLQKRGFLPENITSIKDELATRKGILQEFQTFMDKVKPGDVIYFQFSGHGQQVADDNNDEEFDGYDEAIVPYDSPWLFKPGVYQGENLIRDDELNRLFTTLRRKLGPKGNLMVVIDACQSGTATRGMETARGTYKPMASEDYIKSSLLRPSDGYAIPQFDDGSGAGVIAPMVAFFGSAQNQLNYETRDEQGKGLGSLTYALSKQLGQSPVNVSYRGLFDRIRTEMGAIAPRQQPQAEGMLDQEILGGRLLEKPSYWHVTRWSDPGTVSIDAGWVQGLNEGAVVGLFPPETQDTTAARPLARGTVTSAAALEAVLTLDKDVSQETAVNAWAIVLEQNFGALRLGVSLEKLPPESPVFRFLSKRLATLPMIRLDGPPELFVVQAGPDVELVGQGEQSLEKMSGALPPATIADRLSSKMLAYAQAKYLRKMEATSENLKVSFELIPIKLDKTRINDSLYVPEKIPVETKKDAAGNLHFKSGDAFQIKVTNNGTKTAYFTLLDIQPNNVVSVMIPLPNKSASEYTVRGNGGTSYIRWPFEIFPPSGVEMIKLIATEKAVDLKPMDARTRANVQQNPNPLQILFGQTVFNQDISTRGGKTPNLAAGALHVQSFTFIID